MYFKVLLTLAVVLLAYGNASTLPEATINSTEINTPQCSETSNSEFGDASRVTCDLFASEPLCAAHCLLIGYSGGYCNSQKVCTCRRSLSDAVQQSDEQAPCGGGCVTSSQCAAYAGTTNCRCTWFECFLYTAEADLTDVQQFDIFIKQYSGNTPMLTSAERAYRKRQ
ncbi:U-Asilidin(12)-Dg3b [Pseudolycoriella hygida]|uniref:U-Asilidin(12)-Dg3b n=1 Tax=Pseudolycoriella hygida TaxID=35572 RepID=A0A9Q0RY62_9DIPT|nr:U-Asilidin(12)-Dg3b [Pseudolycoriella hygida]